MAKTDQQITKDRNKRRQLQAVPGPHDTGTLGQGGKCNAKLRHGDGRCTRDAGWGTMHYGWGACSTHGGNSPSLQRNAAKAEVRSLAAEYEMDPIDAVKLRIRLAAGAVAYYRMEIDELADQGVTMAWAAKPDDKSKTQALLLAHYEERYLLERRELGEAAKLAIVAGLEERRVALEEERAQILIVTLRNVLLDLDLTPEQRIASGPVVRKHLRAIDAQAS